MTFTDEAIQGPRLDPDVFCPESVAAAALAVTERLRHDGDNSPALSDARVEEIRHAPPTAGGVFAVELLSDLAQERVYGPVGPLRLRILSSRKARACYLHLHGGGWALGGPDRQDQSSLRFARAARVAVVAVACRLTPEHPHPAGLLDCMAAVRWLGAGGVRELGGSRLIVRGESAGAHLAALALLLLRDNREIAAATAANLAYGVYDVPMIPSARRWGDKRIVINTPDQPVRARRYGLEGRHRAADVSPLYADVTDMPTALFCWDTLDPLLDDTLFMATRWPAAGGSARLAIHPGAPHKFPKLRDSIPAALDAREGIVEFVDRVLTGGQPCT
jgi:acetyl esterase